MFAFTHQREEHAIPFVAFVRFNRRSRRNADVELFLIFLQFLDDNVAELLQFDRVFRWQLPENLTWKHPCRLVKVAPMLRGGQGTLQVVGTGSCYPHFFRKGPLAALMNQSGSKGIPILGEYQKTLWLDLSVQSLQINGDELWPEFVQDISAIDDIDLLNLRRKLCQRFVMHYLRIVGQIFAQFSHFTSRLDAIDRPCISELLDESRRARREPCSEIDKTRGLEIGVHLFNFVEGTIGYGIGPWHSIQQVGYYYILRVFDFRFNRLVFCLAGGLLLYLQSFLLGCEVDLLYSSMVWQLLLQLLELQPFIQIVVNFLFTITKLHQICKMEGYIPQTRLVVLVEYLLHVLHVVIRQILLCQPDSGELSQSFLF